MNSTLVGAAIKRITTLVTDAALIEASEHGVEEIVIAFVGAGCDVAVAGHDLELLHMVNLKTKVVGGYAEYPPVLIVPPTDRNVSAITGTVSFWAFAAMRTGCHFEPVLISAVPPVPDLTMRTALQAAGVHDHSALDLGSGRKTNAPGRGIANLESLAVDDCTSFAMSCASPGRSRRPALDERKHCLVLSIPEFVFADLTIEVRFMLTPDQRHRRVGRPYWSHRGPTARNGTKRYFHQLSTREGTTKETKYARCIDGPADHGFRGRDYVRAKSARGSTPNGPAASPDPAPGRAR